MYKAGPLGGEPVNVFWFRRDLRLKDNHGLLMGLKSGRPVVPVFIFDDHILKHLSTKDARVEFIVHSLNTLCDEIQAAGSTLYVFRGHPTDVWPEIFKKWNVVDVYCNEDYEPYARFRDQAVAKIVEDYGGQFRAFKDHVIFAGREVVKEGGDPFRVYTPYSRSWLKLLKPEHFKSFPSEQHLQNFKAVRSTKIPSLESLGFKKTGLSFPAKAVRKSILLNYHQTRDFMGVRGTTHLGVHLRFGTISLRHLVRIVQKISPTYLKELIWRDFFMQVLFHYPHTVNEPFNSRFKNIKWRNTEDEFLRWCEGKTGYPLVDAGMRELNTTGLMHNRARMISASFLTKHLLIDWRWGERYFAEKLLDFDLSANVGNWQWVAGCGCDAAPYFRIFNPTLQSQKFDPDGEYIKKWVPDQGVKQYPKPMVDHEWARRRVLVEFKRALEAGGE